MNSRLDKLAPGRHTKLALVVDCIAVFVLAFWSTNTPEVVGGHAILLATVAVGSWLLSATVLRHYSPLSPRSPLDSLALVLVGTVATTTVVGLTHLSASWTLADTSFDTLRFVTTFSCAIAVSRLGTLRRRSEAVDDALIIGTGPMGLRTHAVLTEEAQSPVRVVGFLAFPGQPMELRGTGAPVLGRTTDLLGVIRRHGIAEVFIAERTTKFGDQIQALVHLCEELGIPFAVPLHSVELRRAQLADSPSGKDGYLHYVSTQAKPTQHAVKRLIDIVASLTALVVLSPLLLSVAFLIRLTSRGPVLFKQNRVGLHGTRFNLFKFRSMVVNAEELRESLTKHNEQSGPVFKMENDPRVTGIGRFIRKYSIDELPQLINILRGDMTIVGPRPALPSEVEQYEPWHRRRLCMRPGLTCYWQVSGRNEIGFDDWIRLDLQYVDTWSLTVDINLILKTFPVVLSGRGAS
ncbi:sugar transferase [Myxococcota bacterium]